MKVLIIGAAGLISESVRHWFASPRAAIGVLIRAAELDSAALGAQRTPTMPGLSATVRDQIEALKRAAGDGAAALILRRSDAAIETIIAGWPKGFDASRAEAPGFRAESSFDEIIRVHLADEPVVAAPA